MSGIAASFEEIDYLGAFGVFPTSVGTALRRYYQLSQSLGESELMRKGTRFKLSMGPTGATPTLDHAGKDHLRAFMSDFRQLWMQNEATRFQTVRNLIRQNAMARGTPASDEAIRPLDRLGRRYKDALREPLMYVRRSTGGQPDLRPIGDGDTPVTANEVIDWWLYSGPVHWNEQKAIRRSQWSPTTYEFSLIKAVAALCDVYWELDVAIRFLLDADGVVPVDERHRLWNPPDRRAAT